MGPDFHRKWFAPVTVTHPENFPSRAVYTALAMFSLDNISPDSVVMLESDPYQVHGPDLGVFLQNLRVISQANPLFGSIQMNLAHLRL